MMQNFQISKFEHTESNYCYNQSWIFFYFWISRNSLINLKSLSINSCIRCKCCDRGRPQRRQKVRIRVYVCEGEQAWSNVCYCYIVFMKFCLSHCVLNTRYMTNLIVKGYLNHVLLCIHHPSILLFYRPVVPDFGFQSLT